MIEITKSETFWNHDIEFQSKILNETISEFIDDVDNIINIQFLDSNGSMRYVIYTKTESK